MIVIDASIMVEVVIRSDTGRAIEERFLDGDDPLHAPHVLDLDVANALRHCLARGEIDDRRGREALADLTDIPIERHPHRPLLERVWQLRHNLTAYDAAYLALAETLGAPVVTRDKALASVVGHRARVELA